MSTYILIGKTPFPASSMDWARWWKFADERGLRRVGDDVVFDRRISTVFLGMDHNFFGGPPILFETMIFAVGSYSDLYVERYQTWGEAEEGHQRIVEEAKKFIHHRSVGAMVFLGMVMVLLTFVAASLY